MPVQKTIKLSYATHQQQTVVRIDFSYDVDLAASYNFV